MRQNHAVGCKNLAEPAGALRGAGGGQGESRENSYDCELLLRCSHAIRYHFKSEVVYGN